MAGTGKSRTKRRWIRWVAGGGGGLVVVGLLLLWAAVARPGWYRPAMVGPEDYSAIRNELPNFGSAIGTYLERGQPFRITVRDEQVNRWLAARGEIWPGLRDVLPKDLAEPAIAFQPGRVVMGIRYDGSKISSVLSLAVGLEVEPGRGAIHVSVNGLRAGCLPVPRMLVDGVARKALDREAGKHVNGLVKAIWSQTAEYLPVEGMLKGSAPAEVPLAAMLGDIWEFRVPSKSRWPNGGFPYTISDVRIEEGKLMIDVTPMPRPGTASGKAIAAGQG